jgi:protocatechuate 3,4-dioxygenase beta subunit
VSGAVVEIWQANTHGRYTHPNDRNPSPLDPNFEGYGACKTEADGRFRFKTIKPGSYLTPSSGVMRTPHIHFQVTSGPIRFVTQMYFEGEKLNDTDSELQSAAYKDMLVAKILPPTKDLEPNSLIANWDVILIRS